MATKQLFVRSALSLTRRHSTVATSLPRAAQRAVPKLNGAWQRGTGIAAARAQPCSRVGRRWYSEDATPEEKRPTRIWTFEELRTLSQDPDRSVVIIDVREPDELRKTGRVPGALNVPITTAPDSFFLPVDAFADRFGFARPARDAEVVFYCRAGVRSHAAAELARSAGWLRVGEYPGSWLEWEKNGGEVEAQEPTKE